MGYIYKITNKIDKKCYIGQTTRDLNERFRAHRKKNSNCIYLRNAIQQYGKENFKFELICICFDDDLNEYEKEYIKKFDCIVPNGYNLKTGGDNGWKHSEETKKRIGQKSKGRTPWNKGKVGLQKHTEETKKKLSEINKGKRYLSRKQVKCKEETKKKLSNIMKCSLNVRKVQKLNLDEEFVEEFKCISDAAKSINTLKQNIYNVCIGKRKTHRGFIWKYSEA